MAFDDPIGLVGLGLVGNALARRLTAAGLLVVGRDSDRDAGEAARAIGVEVVDDVGSVGARCKVVFLSLPDSAAVDDVLWGPSGLGAACAPKSVVIDTTTSNPKDTVRHFHRLAGKQVRFVDCPLVGSSQEIGDGQGVAIVGDLEAAAAYAPLLRTFAKEVFFLGAPGQAIPPNWSSTWC